MAIDKRLGDLNRDELQMKGFGSLGVEEVTHCTMTLPDGCRLALRIWGPLGSLQDLGGESLILIPGQKGSDTYPAVLEYLPYRKADYTADRDHKRHPWLASHGYVVVRADMRGSGDSDGVYHDEYLAQEQDDCCHLISWISRQPWCAGKVGMYGKSWGGFNGLQVASLQPPNLAAVISLFSTDNRFEDDIHWKGGCVLGAGMLPWAATMFCWDARPPHPRYNPTKWREVWLMRLKEAGECCVKTWLEHQTYDSYWKHGSVGQDPTKVDIPVLAIGGWHDGYTRCALRMAESLPKCSAIVGPWSHNWPDEALPGPNIAFMDECLAWWDRHLKGQIEGEEPEKVRWYLCSGVLPPAPGVINWPGKWQSGNRISGEDNLVFTLCDQQNLVENSSGEMTKAVSVIFSGSAGLQCGEWLSFGAPDLPGDQRSTAPYQACWYSAPLALDIDIFGGGVLTIEVEANQEVAQVYCGLCHQFDNGALRLISYGLLKLNGLDKDRKLTTGKFYKANIQLDPIGYTIPSGDSLVVTISPGSWPTSWPDPHLTTLTIHSGTLSLPVVREPVTSTDREMFAPPRLGPSKDIQVLRPSKFERNVNVGLSDTVKTLTVRTDEGLLYYPDVDTEIDEVNTDKYTIDGDDSTSATAESTRICLITYQARSDNPIRTETRTESWMTADEENFLLTNSLYTKLNGRDFYTKTWQEKVARNGV